MIELANEQIQLIISGCSESKETAKAASAEGKGIQLPSLVEQSKFLKSILNYEILTPTKK